MVKYLSFHNSSFAFRYFFKVKGKATLWHTPCSFWIEPINEVIPCSCVTYLIYKVTCCVRACMCLSMTTGRREKWRGCVRLSMTIGRREKWQEKDKTQDRAPVDNRRMERYRGPETQVLRAKYRGPETQVLRVKYRGSETQVLRAKYRGPETQILRAKCSNAGLQARPDCVRPSRVPTS